MDERATDHLLERIAVQTFEAGAFLLTEGEIGDAAYVLLAGSLQVLGTRPDGSWIALSRLEPGVLFGEQALLGRAGGRRAVTVRANGPVTVARISASDFHEALPALHPLRERLARLSEKQLREQLARQSSLFRTLCLPGWGDDSAEGHSPELREYLARLESVYQLPRHGFVTHFAGRFLDRECITSVYHLSRRRRAVASHVPGEELTNLIVNYPGDEADLDAAKKVRFEDPERQIEREIVVSPRGILLSLTSRGEWAELPELFALALDGGALAPWQCAAFADTGAIALETPPTFNTDEEIVCACMQVRRREVRQAILAGYNTVGAIRERCRAGSACGACTPRLEEMLGKSAWTPARIAHEIEVAPGIRAFRLVPTKGGVRPALPGQHIVVQAQIDGRWIERPYTLSAPTSSRYYEITVKRVTGGLFSCWLLDRRDPKALIRISEPQGDFTMRPGEAPAVYLVAGIGVTPAIAACRSLLESGAMRRVHIDYSARKPELCVYAGDMESAAAACPGLSVHVRYTGTSGRLSADAVAAIVAANHGADYFLCGPVSYLDSVQAMLVAAGVPAPRIRSEEFVSVGEGVPPPSLPLSRVGGPLSVRRPSIPPSMNFPSGVPSTTRSGAIQRPPGGVFLSGGGCPVAHGTHREDGIGMVPPIAAGQRASVSEEARAYLAQCYREKGAPKAFAVRWAQVSAEIERTGTYTQTYDELSFGAKLAWRNATRCIGRLFWNGLQVRDLRHITSEEEMLSALVEHIELATNGGNLRALMTVFAPAGPSGRGPRIWNSQLLRYAGYRNADGSILGDPMNAELTERAQRLGWKGGPRTRFDLLPLIVELPGREPKWMDIPRRVVREVQITHPDYPWFADLGLKWVALPAVSDMLFDLGGVKYSAAPFNGWYMATEIGARNFSDPDRYHLLPEIAERLGLDTRRPATLWKDRAQIELTRAVVHSYERAGVKIVDHHTASEDYLQFIDVERISGRCVHMRWSWITPPIGGSSTPVFHLDEERFSNVPLKPNFFYQPHAWVDRKA